MNFTEPLTAQVLTYAVRDHLDKLECLTLGQMMPDDSFAARQNDKRPAYFNCCVPDSWVKNLKNSEKLQDAWIMVRIPREVIQEMEKPLIHTPYD